LLRRDLVGLEDSSEQKIVLDNSDELKKDYDGLQSEYHKIQTLQLVLNQKIEEQLKL
jgi:hypothetical protein